jgi:hypothetical protein
MFQGGNEYGGRTVTHGKHSSVRMRHH